MPPKIYQVTMDDGKNYWLQENNKQAVQKHTPQAREIKCIEQITNDQPKHISLYYVPKGM